MDLDNLNCPQYVRFSSESFMNSGLDSSLSDLMDNSNQNSYTESQQSEMEDSVLTTASSDEYFAIHTRVSRSQAAKLRTQATKPQPFHFETDSRVKKASGEVQHAEKDFASQLRQHHSMNSSKASGVTKVKPFNLHEPKAKKEESTYLSMAEQINQFHKKTPERFHSSSQKNFQPQAHWSPPKLRPRTPKLQAVKRCRPVMALSREEQEEKELEEMKAFEFHARPVDPRVYEPELVEIPKAKKAKVTTAKGVELRTAQRSKPDHTSVAVEETYKFRARPVPKKILSGPVGLGEKPEVMITKPNPPKFSTDKRLMKRKLMEQERDLSEMPTKKGKRKLPPPPPKPEPLKRRRTEVQPFSFDKVDKERFKLKEKKIQEEIEKENKPFVFKAQLLPPLEASELPKVRRKSATKPKPFNFILDQRKLSSHSFAVEEENVSFKAQPASVLYKEPFIPEKPQRSLVEFQEFSLYTDRRASERLKLKEQKDLEEQERERLLQLQRAREEEKEREEIQKLRQELVHKANPIPEYKPLEIKRGVIPATVPLSPKFRTDERLQLRSNSSRNTTKTE